jgi:ATP-dependent Zn protease
MKWIKKNIVLLILLGLIVALTVFYIKALSSETTKGQYISYSQFKTMVENKKISEVDIISPSLISAVGKNNKYYITDNPESPDFKEYLLSHDIKTDTSIKNNYMPSVLSSLAQYAMLFLVLLFLMKYLTKNMPGINSGINTKTSFVKGTVDKKYTFDGMIKKYEDKKKVIINLVKRDDL